MATHPKTFLPGGGRVNAEARRIRRIAGKPAVSNAQGWFLRERAWINEKHLQLCRIPAPTFFEQQRAEWFRDQLAELRWDASLDRAGNVLARFGVEQQAPELVLSAHLDTVFAPGRPDDVYVAPDGRLIGPGVSDNGAGLSSLLALARLLSETIDLYTLAASVLLVANVGEEGEGNLSGMRYLCRPASIQSGSNQSGPNQSGSNHAGASSQAVAELASIKAFVVLDGPSTDHITAQALASRRFEINLAGPGGHSWNDYGTPNPVHALSQTISLFVEAAEARLSVEGQARGSYNFGIIEGGTSINSIPANARAKLDIRSDEPAALDELAALLTAAVERGLERENALARSGKLSARIKDLGSRPGGGLPEDSPLLRTIQAVDGYLGIRSRVNCASTDANVPLAMGLPAISIGAGGQGGGAHTANEWYRPDGRDLGLRRIFLLLAALLDGHQTPDSAGA